MRGVFCPSPRAENTYSVNVNDDAALIIAERDRLLSYLSADGFTPAGEDVAEGNNGSRRDNPDPICISTYVFANGPLKVLRRATKIRP
jgi:hypothetical protein